MQGLDLSLDATAVKDHSVPLDHEINLPGLPRSRFIAGKRLRRSMLLNLQELLARAVLVAQRLLILTLVLPERVNNDALLGQFLAEVNRRLLHLPLVELDLVVAHLDTEADSSALLWFALQRDPSAHALREFFSG